MQIVISISDSFYDRLKDMDIDNDTCSFNESALVDSIQNGTPLEQEPCGDVISRQTVLDAFWKLNVELRPDAIDAILNMVNGIPPVTPQQKCEDITKAFQLGLAFGVGEKHDEINKVIEESKKAVTPQPKMGQWIPCSERLPEKPDNYPYCGIYRTYFLVSLESGCVKTLAYEFERDEWQITGSPVKAWMPLPEPYKASPAGSEEVEE